MNIIVLSPLFLVILGFVWGFWLIFRKGDLVAQPVKMLGYFIGAMLAISVAGLLTVYVFPAWADGLLSLATTSPSVQNFQDRTQQLINDSYPATSQPPVVQPTRPVTVSPLTPPAGSSAAPASLGQAREYTVGMGDTLTKIGQKFGVTARQIQEMNNLSDPNNIKVGQKLYIPQP